MGSQETKVFIAILITSFLIGSIFLYFLTSLMRQYRRNLELQKQNSIAIVATMDKERSRIATDLHDEIGSDLSLAKLALAEIKVQDETDKYRKQALTLSLDQLQVRVREISYDLMPNILLRQGLFSAIRQLTELITDLYRIPVGFKVFDDIDIPDSISINIFRIIQEVLHNAGKHSRADNIVIEFRKKDKLLIIKIADDGIGFNYNRELEETAGLGLKSIQNRVSLMNGQLFVQSEKGKGLSYVLEIPV